MPLFNLSILSSQRKQSASRASYTTNIETGIVGSVYLTDEGIFKVKVDNTFYNVSQKSLVVKGKKTIFAFNNKEKSGIVVIIVQENNITDFAHPYMSLAPGYRVKGNIIENINKEQLFDVHKVLLEELDIEARKNFLNNKDYLIKVYNERNKTIDSC